jgi:hypothetical protein
MPEETGPLEDTTDSAAYRWTIRCLYAAAIGMNIYIAWSQSRDEVEMALLRQKASALMDRCRAPFRRQQQWRKDLGRMHGQVMETLPDAYEGVNDA